MPSAQVLDFGPDPFVESVSKFAQGFSDTFFKNENQKKNDAIFSRIKKAYGADATPERMLKDIIEAEGFDEEYKQNKIKEVTEYAKLASKKNLTPYQQESLDIRKEELKLKKDKAVLEEQGKAITAQQAESNRIRDTQNALRARAIDEAAKKNSNNFPKLISDYTNSVLKDSGDNLSASDKSLLNSRVQANVKDDGMSVDEAFNEALEYVDLKNQIVEGAEIEPRPTSFIPFTSPSPQEIEKGMEKAFQQLEQLYDAGVESQRDLRAIAKKGGWQPEEITRMLQLLFQRKGKKIKAKPAPAASVDDILFGE